MIPMHDLYGVALVLVDKGRVLLQLRDNISTINYPNHWTFAGGGYLDEGEEPIEAAKRELLEETGYAAKNPKPMGIETYTLDTGQTMEAHRFYETYDGVQKIECNEGRKMEFKTIEEAKLLKLKPGVLEVMQAAIGLAST